MGPIAQIALLLSIIYGGVAIIMCLVFCLRDKWCNVFSKGKEENPVVEGKKENSIDEII